MSRPSIAVVSPFVVATLLAAPTARPADPPVAGYPSPGVSSPEDTELVTAKPVAAPPGAPTSGWHSGTFFLRDENDNFRLYVQGRVHVDFVSFFGPGVGSLPPANALKDGF